MAGLVRIILIVAGAIAALFVARDAVNFQFIEMIVTILLLGAAVVFAALWGLRRRG